LFVVVSEIHDQLPKTAKFVDQETCTVNVTVSPGAALCLSDTMCAESKASTLTVCEPDTQYAGLYGLAESPQAYGSAFSRPASRFWTALACVYVVIVSADGSVDGNEIGEPPIGRTPTLQSPPVKPAGPTV